MLILFAIKLLFFNFVHTIIMGFIGTGLGLLLNLIGVKPEKYPNSGLNYIIDIFLNLPLILILPVVTAKSVALCLAIDPSRINFLWWILAGLVGVSPMAYSRSAEEASKSKITKFVVPACLPIYLLQKRRLIYRIS